jgi:hypothetical protein
MCACERKAWSDDGLQMTMRKITTYQLSGVTQLYEFPSRAVMVCGPLCGNHDKCQFAMYERGQCTLYSLGDSVYSLTAGQSVYQVVS